MTLEMPDGVAPAGLPSFSYHFRHNRLPFALNFTLSDPKTYETGKLLNRRSARPWKTGKLARTDEHYYYLVWPDSYPDFVLGFQAAGISVHIHVAVAKSSLDKGDFTVQDIERILSSARMTPSGQAR